MRTKQYIAILPSLVFLLVLVSCGGSKKAASSAPKKYERKPIVEVSEDRLKLDVILIDAKTQQEVGNAEEAYRLYSVLLGKDANYGAALYGMSQLMAESGRVDSAIVYVQRAIATSDSNVWYHLWAAQLYGSTRNDKALVATWEKLIQLQPTKLDYYYELSNSYIHLGDIPKAVEALDRVEQMVGVTEPVALQKQKLWNAVNRPDKARKEIENLAASLPNETKYNSFLAESYMKEKNYKKAKYYYDRALAANPDDEYLNVALASYYKSQGMHEQAFRALQKGFAGQGLDEKSKLTILAQFYTQEEFYGSQSKYAFALLEQFMQQATDTLTYAVFYGDVLMRQGKYAEAQRQFLLSLSTDSSEYEIWEALLICENEMGAEAEEQMVDHARRAASLFPFHILPRYLQGFVAFEKKQWEEAAKHFRECETIGFTPMGEGRPGHLEPETYSLLAECYHSLGEDELCFSYYDKLLAIFPDDIYTLNNYAYYLGEKEIRLEEAERMSAKTIAQSPHEATFLDTYAWILHKLGRHSEALKYIKKAIANDKKNSQTLQNHLEVIQKNQ